MPAHRQEYRGAPGFPETRSRGLTAVTGTFRPTGWDRARRSLIHHESQSIIWKPDSSSRGPVLRSPGCHPPPLIVALGSGTAAIWLCCGHRRPLASVIRRDVTGGKSSLTVAATNIGDGTKAPGPFNVRLNDRLIQFPPVAMEAAKPGSRSRSTDVFCGWQGRRAARRPSGRRPSRFPRPRVPLRGAHINPCGPTGCRQALHQYQTQGDAHEATRSGIARCRPTEEPGPGTLLFRSSGYRASIRRPKPPGPPNNGTPEHPQPI